MANNLKGETSPYLLQHAENPVHWYPWGEAAFEKARAEDKPVFLSIGYSTCHWCHVMAHESFEDEEVAELLNQHFVSIKVDKEERPDIDSVYMAVCQAFTGSGGWPMSIFMAPDQKPFFAGSYFPKNAGRGSIGFINLLKLVAEKWRTNRAALLQTGEEVTAALKKGAEAVPEGGGRDEELLDAALKQFERSFDRQYGGFGGAPKFPAPHNLLFLLQQYEKKGRETALWMAEKTLQQMYRGGLFDHIGYGFARYSTDAFFLAPHFEKMLYDNALLIMAYSKAFSVTKDPFYRRVAEKTARYILHEMTSPEGGFYSAQDADSEGVEGKYYLFTPLELTALLGEKTGLDFCGHYDITAGGNFEGKSIPNLLKNEDWREDSFTESLPQIYAYRKGRTRLHTDDKILASWNSLMIAAMAALYRVTGEKNYLSAAVQAESFLSEKLCRADTLFISYRDGRVSGKGLLDDYAAYTFALLALYEATYRQEYLLKAECFCRKAVDEFADPEQGGFYLSGAENERLIACPKETYDGAVPCGNALMADNFVRLHLLTGRYQQQAERQLTFMSDAVRPYPTSGSFFLTALSDFLDPPEKVTVAVKNPEDLQDLPTRVPLGAAVVLLDTPSEEYPLRNNRTTYYICRNRTCLPPVNQL